MTEYALGKNQELYFTETIIYAVVAGVGFACLFISELYALANGTIVLVSAFGAAGLLIPSIAGIFLYDEKMSVWQWVFVGVFLVGAYMLKMNSKKVYGVFSLKNLMMLVLTFLFNGLIMLMQTMFGRNVKNGSTALFSSLSFLFGIMILLLTLLILKTWIKKRKINYGSTTTVEKKTQFLKRKNLIISGILGLILCAINILSTESAKYISPVIFFAVTCGGATIISAIVGAVAFKEKLTVVGITGMILGIGSLILIKVFAVL
ncbi:MAG: hypothetical protein J6Y43_00305 [Clostridia bacterium]|nr:hypothetical protein [Clostridia bacterium]